MHTTTFNRLIEDSVTPLNADELCKFANGIVLANNESKLSNEVKISLLRAMIKDMVSDSLQEDDNRLDAHRVHLYTDVMKDIINGYKAKIDISVLESPVELPEDLKGFLKYKVFFHISKGNREEMLKNMADPLELRVAKVALRRLMQKASIDSISAFYDELLL